MQDSDTNPTDVGLLTTAQLAELLGVTPQTVRAWRAEGEGPPYFYLTSRTIRYRREEVDRWLSTRHNKPTGPSSLTGTD